MNATQKSFLANMFGWAEHEVEDNIKKFTDAIGHVLSSDPTAAPAAAGPSQSDFDALKAEVEMLRGRFDDLVPEQSASTGTQGDPAPQS